MLSLIDNCTLLIDNCFESFSKDYSLYLIPTLTTRRRVMFGEHHDIPKEFPEYKEVIKRLCEDDTDFKLMYIEYHSLDDEILKIEQHIEATSDTYAEDLKKKRALLKDRIYTRLLEEKAAA